MKTISYPALRSFLGCYFHEDFYGEFPGPDAAVTAYLDSNPKEAIAAARRELREVISQLDKMDNLKTFLLDDLGCYYNPQADNSSVAEWLRHVLERLEECEH